MARPKETDEVKVKKVYPHARLAHVGVNVGVDGANSLDIDTVFSVINYTITKSNVKKMAYKFPSV
jgi:hypothetical protein